MTLYLTRPAPRQNDFMDNLIVWLFTLNWVLVAAGLWLETFIRWLLTQNWTVLLGGFWGGSVYVLYKRDSLSRWGAASTIITGVIVAHYGAEWMAERVSAIASAGLGSEVRFGVGPAGFLCGIGGQIIVAGLIAYLEKKKEEYIKDKKDES